MSIVPATQSTIVIICCVIVINYFLMIYYKLKFCIVVLYKIILVKIKKLYSSQVFSTNLFLESASIITIAVMVGIINESAPKHIRHITETAIPMSDEM